MPRLAPAILLVFFAAFISAPLVAWGLGVQGGGTALQNRSLAKRPPLTLEKVWSGDFGKEFTDWVWDAIPLRDKALKMDHTIDFYAFGDSPSRDAFFGLDGWTWRRERVLQDIRAGGGDPKDMKKALDRIEAAFADAGVGLHIVVTPTKASIYPEYLPARYREAYLQIASPMEEYLLERTKTDPALIDVWTPLREEKERLLELPESELARPEMRYLWRKNDNHWNVEGGRIQARAIINAIDPALWDERKAPSFTGQFQEQESELSRLYFKLDIREPYQAIKQSPLVQLTTQRKTVKPSTNAVVTMTSKATASHTPKDMTVLVVRDSMLSEHGGRPAITRDAGVPTLAAFFARSIFLHWETLQQTRKGKELPKLLEGIDHVVIQVTQGSNYYLVRRAGELADLAKLVKKGREAKLKAETEKSEPAKSEDVEEPALKRPRFPGLTPKRTKMRQE